MTPEPTTIVHATATPLNAREGHLDLHGPMYDVVKIVADRCAECPGTPVLYAVWINGVGAWGVVESTYCDRQPCRRA